MEQPKIRIKPAANQHWVRLFCCNKSFLLCMDEGELQESAEQLALWKVSSLLHFLSILRIEFLIGCSILFYSIESKEIEGELAFVQALNTHLFILWISHKETIFHITIKDRLHKSLTLELATHLNSHCNIQLLHKFLDQNPNETNQHHSSYCIPCDSARIYSGKVKEDQSIAIFPDSASHLNQRIQVRYATRPLVQQLITSTSIIGQPSQQSLHFERRKRKKLLDLVNKRNSNSNNNNDDIHHENENSTNGDNSDSGILQQVCSFGNRTRPNNKKRHLKFVKYILDLFPKDMMNSGSGVLDVAGGQGKVFPIDFMILSSSI